MSFKGKVALITGASSGIGADAALHLAKLGAQVSMVGRNKERLNEVAEQIQKSGGPVPLQIVADVTKDSERIVDETIKHFGKLDILINNAGIAFRTNICDLELLQYMETFEVNVTSVVILTKLCVPYLEKTKGNIINVSSACSIKTVAYHLSYSMSKAALDQFTKCCALDLAAKGIRVNSINPAMIQTPILSTLNKPSEFCKKTYPLGRIGEVSDTSKAIEFLANDDSASFLTGILLPVDGGALTSGPILP